MVPNKSGLFLALTGSLQGREVLWSLSSGKLGHGLSCRLSVSLPALGHLGEQDGRLFLVQIAARAPRAADPRAFAADSSRWEVLHFR